MFEYFCPITAGPCRFDCIFNSAISADEAGQNCKLLNAANVICTIGESSVPLDMQLEYIETNTSDSQTALSDIKDSLRDIERAITDVESAVNRSM